MKMLTKNTDYAVRALLCLGESGDGSFVPASEIARREDIPERFLKVLLQKLIRTGILQSKEGAGGGVMLARDPGDIRLTDVIRVFQGEVRIAECKVRGRDCPARGRCVLRRRIVAAERNLVAELEAVTVDTLLQDRKEDR